MSTIIPQDSTQQQTSPYWGEIEQMSHQRQYAAAWLNHHQEIILMITAFISPWVVPLAPAGFVGWEMWHVISSQMPQTVAFFISFSVVIGLEAVGGYSAHTTLIIYDQWRFGRQPEIKLVIGISLVATYAVTAISVIFLLKYAPVESVGVGAVIFTLVTYIARAINIDANHVAVAIQSEDRAIIRGEEERRQTTLAREEEDRQDARRRKDEDRAWGHELKMMKLRGQEVVRQGGNPTNLPPDALPKWLAGLAKLPKTKEELATLVASGQVSLPQDATLSAIGEDIAKVVPGLSPRTGRMWASYARRNATGSDGGGNDV